jgi:hypothetical protein
MNESFDTLPCIYHFSLLVTKIYFSAPRRQIRVEGASGDCVLPRQGKAVVNLSISELLPFSFLEDDQ